MKICLRKNRQLSNILFSKVTKTKHSACEYS